jgi:hypothetical protein
MKSEQLIEDLETITRSNIHLTETHLQSLSNEQLLWKPKKESWNILEIMAHLNQYANYYQEAFKKKMQKTRYNVPTAVFTSSPLGKSAWKSMKLGNARNVKRKIKSPKAYNPTYHKELVTGNDLTTFLTFQNELLELIIKATSFNLKRVKIPISVSKIIRLRLGDALMFVVFHNERHVQQALNLLSNKDFPQN